LGMVCQWTQALATEHFYQPLVRMFVSNVSLLDIGLQVAIRGVSLHVFVDSEEQLLELLTGIVEEAVGTIVANFHTLLPVDQGVAKEGLISFLTSDSAGTPNGMLASILANTTLQEASSNKTEEDLGQAKGI